MRYLEDHFRKVELTLGRVFGVDSTTIIAAYRENVARIPEKHRLLVAHTEPYDKAAQLLGYRSGGAREDPRFIDEYEKLREMPIWRSAERLPVAS